jgi:site-specific DNA-cytosine methylase
VWRKGDLVVAEKNFAGGRLRFVEFFAGLGGFAACCEAHEIVAAIDIDQAAKNVYEANFPHPYFNVSLESVEVDWLEAFGGNAWWLSPPCQPYSRRGRKRDREDPRSRGLENLLLLIPQLRPRWILLENVLGFATSAMFDYCRAILEKSGYAWQVLEVCPSEWGWPNRRPRFYLMATTNTLPQWKTPPKFELSWRGFVDKNFSQELLVEERFLEKFRESLDRLTEDREHEPTACFGSSYGVVSSGAGSYLEYAPGCYRRFSPEEVLRLLGFPEHFQVEQAATLRKQWKLAGNSLSLPVVRYLLSHVT